VKTAKTPRAGRFPLPRRGPRCRSRLGLLTALDAVRHLSPPRPQRGPRRRRRPSPPSVPRPTPVPQRLGVFNHRPPPWFCGTNQETCLPSPLAPFDPGVDATAAARPKLLHGSSPSTLDARVPAIQRPSARLHRTVDNSLITGRLEYSHSSISPLMSALSTHLKQTTRSEIRKEQRSKKNSNK